jgi:UDP-N-acetylmuramoyl-tripeptide--D-alanyl-D-alanine ligase
MTIAEIAAAVDGTIMQLDPGSITTASPVIDSRKADPTTFFIALPGARVDGNDFAQSAISAGAQFSLMTVNLGLPSIIVKDAAAALTALAGYARQKMTTCTFIAITGSQGKTTTKDLAGQILSTVGEVVVPQGSFNNEIGVPLTILQCSDTTQFCLLEMGARHVGDIASLVRIAAPTIGVVLVVGSAHVGEFGSRELIARAKSELVADLPAGGCAILGSYDPFTPQMPTPLGVKRVIFGQGAGAQVRAADIEIRGGCAHFDLVAGSHRAPVTLRILGEHQIANALAAAAIGLEVGMSVDAVAAALSEIEVSSKWRMELHNLAGIALINDSYNANPESMAAALKTLVLIAQESGGASWAFLGKMHELGELEGQAHLGIGRLASELGVDHLVSIGTDLYFRGLELTESESMSVYNVLTQEEAFALAQHIEDGDVVLVKASRAEHLDELAEKILASWQVEE